MPKDHITPEERRRRLQADGQYLFTHPAILILQVEYGPLRPEWRIISGKKKSYFRRFYLEGNWISWTVLAGFCTLVTIPAFLSEPSTDRSLLNFVFGWFLTAAVLLLIINACCFIFDRSSHDPHVVLLPDGVVEVTEFRNISIAILFRHLKTVRWSSREAPNELYPLLDFEFTDGLTIWWRLETPAYDAISKALHRWQIEHESEKNETL